MTEATPAPEFGRVDADGTVYVRLPSGEEHRVGQWAAGDPAAGLAFFRRRYDDLSTEVDLARVRLADGKTTPDSAHQTAAKVRAAIVEPTCVGDLADLTRRIDELDELVRTRRAAVAEERKAAKAAVLGERATIVAEAERLATSTQWRATSERFKELLAEWQAKPHGDRAAEQELWKRFSHARSAFDKARRAHFASLEVTRAEAKVAKTALVKRAEELSESTDWAATAQAYRDLMAEWKAAPRGTRPEEDRYWAAFRAAQDKFFAARGAALDERDASLKDNLAAKEALAAEAEALLPIKDIDATKAALRTIQERWEKVGHVPRADKDRIEGRLRKVEESVRGYESERWRRTNPEVGARARSTVELFRGSVEKLEKALARAEAEGDQRAIERTTADLAAQRDLLAAAERAAADFSS